MLNQGRVFPYLKGKRECSPHGVKCGQRKANIFRKGEYPDGGKCG